MKATRRYPTLTERLWARVNVAGPDDCWEWQGAQIRNSYGILGRESCDTNGNTLAHRAAYEDCVGPIPDGYQVDHLCRNTVCCNPAHLEAVTQLENLRRQAAVRRKAAKRRTHCKRGHELTPENLIASALRRGSRACKECARLGQARRYANRKARNGVVVS